MDFEEMKVIWDSQNDEPLYAINEKALHAQIQRKCRRFNRAILWRDVREVFGGIVCASWIALEGGLLFIRGQGLALWPKYGDMPLANGLLLAAAVVFLMPAIAMVVGRRRQATRESQFEASLCGDLNRAISQVSYQIRLLGSVVWWGLIPWFLAIAMSLYAISLLRSDSRLEVLLIIGLVVPTVLGFVSWLNRREIKNDLLPRLQNLESLRDKLVESERETNR
jgi:hypothetical protein